MKPKIGSCVITPPIAKQANALINTTTNEDGEVVQLVGAVGIPL